MATIHSVNLMRGVIVDLFDDGVAVPTVSDGNGFIQNKSNSEVEVSNDASFDHFMILGGKLEQPATSILQFESGDSVFLRTTAYSAQLAVVME